jgi:GTP cyclohydrolase II
MRKQQATGSKLIAGLSKTDREAFLEDLLNTMLCDCKMPLKIGKTDKSCIIDNNGHGKVVVHAQDAKKAKTLLKFINKYNATHKKQEVVAEDEESSLRRA